MFIFMLAIGIIGGGMAASLLGIFLVRRLVNLHFLEEHTPVASAFIQIVGTLYAVLIAFSVVTTWDHYQKARDVADREANCLNDIFRFSQGMTVAERDPLQLALIAYGKTVVEDEWDRMASGQESQRSMDAYQRIWDLESQMNPTTDRDRALYNKSLDRLQDMSDARRQRMIFSRGGLGAIMWFTLIAGGVLTIGFSFFFTVRQVHKQMLMTGILAGTVCLNLFTIAVINRPFRGEARVMPDAMRFVVAHMEGTLSRQAAPSAARSNP